MKPVFRNLCTLTASFLVMAFAQDANAQEQKKHDKKDNSEKLELMLSVNHDAFFGLNPAMEGDYHFNEKNALSFYGIIWGAGKGSTWGNWTEVGLGYKHVMGNLSVKPQLGITMGSLLSSGGSGRGIVGDGIVPNIFVDYDNHQLVAQAYLGYYAPLRNNTRSYTVNNVKVQESTNQYSHYWVYAGYKPLSWFTFGVHHERLALEGGHVNGGGALKPAPVYSWVGPYIQFSKGSTNLRFAAGPNVANKNSRLFSDDFYKISFNIDL